MIFLAVSLGFFAENIREHVSDKTKVKGYMKEIIANLRYDTTRCNLNSIKNTRAIAGLDSFRVELKRAINADVNANNLYYFNFLYGSDFGHAVFNTSAITELKSSGFLRLIDNRRIVEELSDYYERKILATYNFLPDNKVVKKAESRFFGLLGMDDYVQSFDSMQRMTYNTSYNFSNILKKDPPLVLLDSDKKELETLYTDEADFEISLKRYNFWLGVCKTAAVELIKDIEEEYDLKGE